MRHQINRPIAGSIIGPDSASQQAGGAYGWTLRQLGAGEIAWVQSGNYSGSSDEPIWTDTSPTGFGMYNGAVRNFASNASQPAGGRAIPTLGGWSLALFAALLVMAGWGFLRRVL